MIKYKYTIYIYTDGTYGTTGIFFDDKSAAIDKCDELIKLNSMRYSIFVEYFDDGIHHRRLIWKDGKEVIKKYTRKLSYTADLVFNFIKSFHSRNKKTPTFLDIKTELQKQDHEIIRVMRSLSDAGLISFTPPYSKKTAYKLKK